MIKTLMIGIREFVTRSVTLPCFLPPIHEVFVTLVKSVIHDIRNRQRTDAFRMKLNTFEMFVVMIQYREPPSSKERGHLDFSDNCSNNQAFISSLSIFSNSFNLASNFFSSLTLHNAFNLAITSLLHCFFQMFTEKLREHHLCISGEYPTR
jgi:hypothetical protein